MNGHDQRAALELAAELGARGGIVRRLVVELVELQAITDRAGAPDDVCGRCGTALVQPARGRRRRWCSDRCRKAAARESGNET